MSADFGKARDIFLTAVDQHGPDRWDAYLDEACAGDAELRRAVERLLRAHAAGGSLFAPGDPDPTAGYNPVAERPGDVIGPYKLLEQIGEGGFGVVFLAEQQEPVRRKVALKILKPGMDTRQVVARFEAERQALAIMDHPHIAKVFDGGATASGRPYFVMELVKGVPITDYCDQNHLTPRQRLELFVDVCQAVQHAHQKGIIHRDIKPSNVLVSRHDTVPVAKVIDFGVAKALGQELTDKTLHTAFAQMVGTPLYMSPEQAGMSDLDVDTRSDIYSLGVLLYELLTGTTPFDRERFKRAACDEIRRIIREEESPRPSTRLSGLNTPHAVRGAVGMSETETSLASVSASRRTEPAKLTKLVRGELDWIVMKALEKDRNRRYETANGFAADVQRYLDDEPVLACPPSAWYRFRKFARRNKVRLIMATSVFAGFATLAVGIGWTVRDRAAHRAATAGAVDEALAKAADWQIHKNWPEALSATQRAEALLDLGGGSDDLKQRVRGLRRDLETAARLEKIRLGQLDVSGKSISTGEAAFREAFQEYGLDMEQLEPDEAAARIRASTIKDQLVAGLDGWVSARRTGTAGPSRERLMAAVRRADPDPWRDRLRDAYLRGDRQALAELARTIEVADVPPANVLLLGQALVRNRDFVTAVRVLRQAQQRHPGDFWINGFLALYVSALSPKSAEAVGFMRAALAQAPQSAQMHCNLGSLWYHQRRDVEAEAEYREAIRLDPRFADPHNNLGAVLLRQGKLDEALAETREALALNPDDALVRTNLGNQLEWQGKVAEAEAVYRDVLRLRPHFAPAHANLGHALFTQGKVAAAEAACREAIRLDPDLAEAHCHLSEILHAQGKVAAAEAACREAIRLKPYLPQAHCGLGLILKTQGKPVEAEAAFREALRIQLNYFSAWNGLGLSLYDQDKLPDAEAAFREALRLKPGLSEAHTNLGNCLKDQGKVPEAEAEYREALRLDPHDHVTHVNLGHIWSSQHKVAEAEAAYREALRNKSDYAPAHNDLGVLYMDQGKVSEAIAAFREAVRCRPDVPLHHSNLASAVERQGKWAEAEAEQRVAIRLKPDFAAGHYGLGIALHNQGRQAEAIPEYREAIRLRPDWGLAYYMLANDLIDRGQWAEAIRAYSKLIELEPRHAERHNELAWLLATCADPQFWDPPRAVALGKNAVRMDPKNGSYWRTLGIAHYRAADWKAAIMALEKAKELGSPGDARDWFPLAMAHWKNGAKEAAREWYDRAVQWMEKNSPKDAELRRFRAEAETVLELKK